MSFNAGEDTFLNVKKFLNCRGRLLDLSTQAVMGIINLTPDSFYDGGNLSDEKAVLNLAETMIGEGADILDIGGQSTRPEAQRISPEEEWDRINPALKLIRNKFPDAIISIDTFYSEVAAKAVNEGASIVNDISGGDFDPLMHKFVADLQVPYVLMHMQGTPETMQDEPHYEDVVSEILEILIHKVMQLRRLGLNDIIIDPGFGFGKTVQHNYTLLKNLERFRVLECPILTGLSRKSMVTKTLNVKSADALNGTTILNTIALLNGASILRVHDVEAAVQVRKIIREYYS